MKLADPPCPFYFREWIWEHETREARLWSRGTVEPLYRGHHGGSICLPVCVLHREVSLIQRWIMFILLVLQTVSSIERCPPFIFLHRLHCIQIHVAIQIPVIYRSHCTHTPMSHIALSSLLADLLLAFTSC